MLNVNRSEMHVVARLRDFFGATTGWQRTLWNSGIVLTLREILQASEQVANGVLSDASLRSAASWAIIVAGRDPGAGDDARKKQVQRALRSDDKGDGIALRSAQYRTIQIIADEMEPAYLSRWATALRNPQNCPGPERTARAIGSHLLDAGFSSDFLHRWWTYKCKYEPGTKALAEIVDDAAALLAQGPRSFEILVAFEHAPKGVPSGKPKAEWLPNKEVSKWLSKHKFNVRGLRQRGGMKLLVEARDPLSAAELATETIDRLISRVSLGSETRNRLVPLPQIWIGGERDPLPLTPRRRRVEIHALHRENRLYDLSEFSIVDAAMELVAPLDSEPPSPAVAGGWGAIEALLTGPGDPERVLAADRMASLVACSFVRAELTTLSYQAEKEGGPIAVALKACLTNRDRCGVLAKTIQDGVPVAFTNDSDLAALARITALYASPSATLRDIEGHVSTCFRRLYRHRNMVLHGAKTDALGLRACLRTAAPLVGAGLDRIAHAWFVESRHPLELAARARLRLDTLGTAGACSPLDLLA